MSASLLLLYLLVSGSIACALLLAFLTDASTSKLDTTSWMVVLVAATLWVVVLPISAIEKMMQGRLLNRLIFSSFHSSR